MWRPLGLMKGLMKMTSFIILAENLVVGSKRNCVNFYFSFLLILPTMGQLHVNVGSALESSVYISCLLQNKYCRSQLSPNTDIKSILP